jgi:serine/threonine-protein kinase HipA
MTDRLIVLLDNQLVGEVLRHRPDTLEFTYDPAYRATGRIPLSPALPISDRRYKHQQVIAYLEGMLPERDSARMAWANQLRTSDNAFDLLAAMGKDCIGAVQFTTPNELSDLHERNGTYHLVTDAEIGARLHTLRTTDASWTMPEEHWSLPGAQEKFTLAHLGDRWHEAHGAAASTHIIKPGVTRLKHQAVLEHATMRAAAALGLTVAHSELRTFGSEMAIVVRRFDRYLAGSEVRRFHQVDFCQAMGRMPANKYEEHQGPRTHDLAAMLRRESARPDADVRRFSDAVLFNYVVGAPDGHSKNFALVYAPDGRARLAPLYDLSSAFAYEPRGGGYNLGAVALSIGGRRKFGEVLQRHIERHAEHLHLDPRDRIDTTARFAADAVPAFRSAFDEIGTAPAQELADKLLPKLQRHTQLLSDRLY